MLPVNLIALFVAPLNRLGVTYMVTGGAAAIMYGEPRLTTDIDLVVVLSDADISKLHAVFDTGEFYVPPVEVLKIEARRRMHGHFNVIHTDTAFRADVYVAGGDALSQWALERRRPVSIGSETVWLAPPEYVILKKLQYLRDGGSAKHGEDIRIMLRTLGDQIDRGELLAQIDQLHLRGEWEKVHMT